LINRLIVKKGVYRDSITLLRLSKQVGTVKGVHGAAVVMATPLNKRVLADMGFAAAEIQKAETGDMVVGIQAEDNASLNAAESAVERLLTADEVGKSSEKTVSTMAEALGMSPDANLAVISVPGAYAKREGLQALRSGVNVFMFSSNVSREDERELKDLAVSKNLLMMGPDCGTAIINHVVLGFGNAVREGSIGIVSASGSGLQEVSCMIHAAGLGITQAIGTGGGDLSDEVGGLTTLQALEILERDEETKVVLVVSKPPGPKTARKVLAALRKSSKPVVVNFLGASQPVANRGKLVYTETLEEAAAAACRFADKGAATSERKPDFSRIAFDEASRLSDSQKFVRGLFAGGTLCYEAQVVLTPLVKGVHSNAPLDKRLAINGESRSLGHTCIDMGAEDFVVGRAHPMIDFTMRKMRIVEEAKDPRAAVILLDVELGLGSNPDPAGELAPAVAEAKKIAAASGRYLSVIASVIGTDGDFQGLAKQEQALKEAGVVVLPSSARAAALAGSIAMRGDSGEAPGRRSR
jgi:FdrA protein